MTFIFWAVESGRSVEKKSFLQRETKGELKSTEGLSGTLKKIEQEIDDFSKLLGTWGGKLDAFTSEIQNSMLKDILSSAGQAEFKKELGKCGIGEMLLSEDLEKIKSFCSDQAGINQIIETLLNDLLKHSKICINVKEKYRIKIQTAFDEYFSSKSQPELDQGLNIFLQTDSTGYGFEAIRKLSHEKFLRVCEELAEITERLYLLKGSVNERLDLIL